jgi:transcriptional regulator with XRE-family HTH domain
MVDMSTGERLKALREAAGLTLQEAGAIAGTTKQSASQIEKGTTKVPGGLFLYRWSKHYNVNLEWLITGKGDQSPVASHGAGWDIGMLSEALVSLDKAIRGKGLQYDAAYVAPALRLAYLERLKHPAKLDRAAYAIYDNLVQQQLEVQQDQHGREHRGIEETSVGGTGKAPAARKTAGAR